jgi:uncharacterized membrane protein
MQYDHVEPGLAREIVDMARQQSGHRQALERTVVSRQSRNETIGIVCATVVALAALYTSVELIRAGFPGAGLVAVLAEVGVLAGVFIARTRSAGKELASKR